MHQRRRKRIQTQKGRKRDASSASPCCPREIHLVPIEPAVLTGSQPTTLPEGTASAEFQQGGARGKREVVITARIWRHLLRQRASSAHRWGSACPAPASYRHGRCQILPYEVQRRITVVAASVSSCTTLADTTGTKVEHQGGSV
ncbi:hypothetical protein TcBrA4_0062110 [Trypanosoma cruzi]|nr:hypothetical protein TcBrA4_0062110 [Trypanosoma cruzi]